MPSPPSLMCTLGQAPSSRIRAALSKTSSGRPAYGPRPMAPPTWSSTPTSFLRHPGLAQTGEIGGFDQGADVGHSPRFGGPQAGDAGITIVADQHAGFRELGGGALVVALVSIGRG